MLPIAIQLYTVRDNAAADFEGTLRAIKAMGYEGVEFAGLYGNSPAKIKALCEEIGLKPISAHVPYFDMVADPKGVLSDYAEIGCNSVLNPGSVIGRNTTVYPLSSVRGVIPADSICKTGGVIIKKEKKDS